jgi:hypothetical protein
MRLLSKVLYSQLMATFMIMCGLGTVGFVAAQSNLGEPIYTGSRIKNVMWSSDSSRLVFQKANGIENGVNVSDNSWIEYSTQSNQLVTRNSWTLLPDLTASEMALSGSSLDGKQSFAFTSPDNVYTILAGEGGINAGFPLMLSNHLTNQSDLLPITILEPFQGTDDFRVYWSDDNTAFAVVSSTLSGLSYIDYANGYDAGTSNIVVQSPSLITVDNQTFITDDVYEVSADGDTLLLRVRVDGDINDPSFKLALWDASHPEKTLLLNKIEGDQFIGAAFILSDETKLLFVDEFGLQQYDLVTQKSMLIQSEISAASETKWLWYRELRGVFSPNAEWLAYITDDSVYVFDVLALMSSMPTQTDR